MLKINEKSYRENHSVYEIIGAGKISISHNAEWSCGNKTGFDFCTDWAGSVSKEWGGKFIGGVLPQKEAFLLSITLLFYLFLYWIIFPYKFVKEKFLKLFIKRGNKNVKKSRY